MKTTIIVILLFVFIALSAQTGYIWERHSFNAAGGAQSGTIYTSVTSFGNIAQGDISSSNYNGYLGFLFPQIDQRLPVITSIDDVPNDQGHQVQVVWNKCGFDDEYAIETFYSLWRYDEEFTLTVSDENPEGNISQRNSSKLFSSKNNSAKWNSSKQSSSKQISSKSQEKYISKISQNIYTEPLIIVEKARQNPNKTYYWQRDRDLWAFVAEIPALNYDEYSYIAPTLADSSNVDTNYSTFKVVYHDLYQYYESVPDSGYSVDNIAPDPTRTTITRNGNYMKLEWDEVEYGTFEGNRYPEINGIWYKVYAGNVPEFVCDQSSYLTTVTDLEYNYPLTGEPMKFYKLVVSDKP